MPDLPEIARPRSTSRLGTALRDLLAPLRNAYTVSRVRELEHQIAMLRFEWAETLDILERWSKRQDQRARRDIKTQLPLEAAAAAPEIQTRQTRRQKLLEKYGHLRKVGGL